MSTDPDFENNVEETAAELAAPLDDGVREITVVRYTDDPSQVADFRPIKGDPDEPDEPIEEVEDLGKDGDDSVPESVSSPDVTLSTGLPALTTGVTLPAS